MQTLIQYEFFCYDNLYLYSHEIQTVSQLEILWVASILDFARKIASKNQHFIPTLISTNHKISNT